MVRIADSLQNAHVNAFAGISFADRNVYFAEKSIAERSALPIPHSPVCVSNLLHMFAMSASCGEAVSVIAPTMLPHRHMLLLWGVIQSLAANRKHTGMSWLLWTSWWLPWSRKASPWLTFILRTETRSQLYRLYRYIDAGMLGVGNLDLRRKVSYRQRRKQKKAIDTITNKKFRETRTYEDFLAYLKKHPGTNYVEMDTVLGTQGKGKRMLTILFVQQSLMLIFLMRDGKANSVVEHFDWLTSALGLKTFRKLFPVILTDNGSEFKYTLEMERTIDGANRTKIFYCDPQASWQKAHIEKNHEYIRYVIPKGKSLDPYTQEDFTILANNINNTKRLQYNGKAPIELAASDEFRELFRVTGIQPIPADDVMLKPHLLKP